MIKLKDFKLDKIDIFMLFMTLFNILCFFSFCIWFGTSLICYYEGESYTTFVHYFFLILTIVLYFVGGCFHDCAYIRRDKVAIKEKENE